MIALGIDPGTLRLGWGVVRGDGNRIVHLAHGVISLPSELSLPERLQRIDQELTQILERFSPEGGSVETLFFHRDAQAAAKLGHARGVVLLWLARSEGGVVEYAPASVKRTIAGHSRAGKRQMAEMVRALLGLDRAPSSDAADALALAVTHLRIGPLQEALSTQRQGSSKIAQRDAPPELARLLRGRRSGRGRRRR